MSNISCNNHNQVNELVINKMISMNNNDLNNNYLYEAQISHANPNQ